jgi:glycosyltransferase involved in cell wall biosynthesis
VPGARIVEGVVPVPTPAAPGSPRTEGTQGHRFIVVGQLIERKNPSLVISAFSSMRAPDDTLVIVGDGPLRESLQRQVAASGLDGSVRIEGHQEPQQLGRTYGDADTLVLASSREVYGLVVVEALTRGLHAVVSRCCGVADTVAGMHGAYVVDPMVESLAAGMRRSKNEWSGPVPDPAVLSLTPETAALHVEQALLLAKSTSQSRRR